MAATTLGVRIAETHKNQKLKPEVGYTTRAVKPCITVTIVVSTENLKTS